MSRATMMVVLFRNELGRIGVEFFYPNAVGVDLALDVAVGGAAHSHADGAACAVPRETHHADVVCKILASELGAESYLLRFLEQFLLEIHVAECTSGLISRGGKSVVVFDAGELHGENRRSI